MSKKGWFNFSFLDADSVDSWLIGFSLSSSAVITVSFIIVAIIAFRPNSFGCVFSGDEFGRSYTKDSPGTQVALSYAEEVLHYKSGVDGTAMGKCHALCAQKTCFVLDTEVCKVECGTYSQCMKDCNHIPGELFNCLTHAEYKNLGFGT